MSSFNLVDLPKDNYIFALFVGENGAGKTSALASIRNPDDPRPICIVDLDKRIKGINGSPWVNPVGIKVEWLPGKHLLAELEGLFTEWELLTAKNKFPYQTVVIDGFTALAMILTDNAFDLTGQMNKGSGGNSRNAQGHPKIGTVDLPGLDEFGYELQGFKNIMTFLKYGLKCNVICTAHWIPKWKKDPLTNATIEDGKKIHLRNSILPNVMLWFDEVWYFEKSVGTKAVVGTGAVKFEKHIVEFRNELARTTIPSLPNSLDITGVPFYPLILPYLKGEEVKK